MVILRPQPPRSMKRVLVGIFALAVVMSLSSWGFLVHKTVNQVAIYQLPSGMRPFFYKNMDYLVYNAPRPDIRRNTDSTEATKHFIDMEAYGDSAAWKMPLYWEAAVQQFTRDTLIKYGYVPYHVVYMQRKLTEAFRSGNVDSILFYAADLGHYIGDAHVPLHTTINYDGQLTNQKGLHALWESVVPEIELDQYQLNSGHKAKYLKNPAEAIMQGVRGAFQLLPDVFAVETRLTQQFPDSVKYRTQMRRGTSVKYYTTAFAKAYGEALKPTINRQLLRSADLLADFWYTAWVDAGKPDLKAITKNWTDADKAALKAHRKSYQRNGLIAEKKLQAKAGASGE